MSKSKSLHAVGICAVLAAGLAVAGRSLGAQSLIVFQGLRHAPIGSAVLRADPGGDALEVSNLAPAGGDGVAVDLGGNAKSWNARMEVRAVRGTAFDMSFAATDQGQRISTESVHQVGSRFAIAPSFTGDAKPTYSAQVYRDGHLVAALGSLPSTAHIMIPISFCYLFPEFFDCGFTTEFHNAPDTSCVWLHRFDQAVDMVLPNGVVARGNELRLVEEVRPAGHYPYLGFDALTVQSNAQLLTLRKETVQ